MMAPNLSGNLSEFSVAEILSLLGVGRRTARMQVTTPDAVGVVFVVDGQVSSATDDCARAELLRAVVAALPVAADDLAAAVGSGDPVRHLVDAGVVDAQSAREVAQEQCTDAMGHLLEWADGVFAVSVGEADPGDIGVRLDVEDLVVAARMRAQQWQELRAELPGPHEVLALVAEVSHAPVLDVADWAVLARINGRRSLGEVISAMGVSQLAAGARVVELMKRGLVAVQVDGDGEQQEQARRMLDSYEAGAAVETLAFEVDEQEEPDPLATSAPPVAEVAAAAEPTAAAFEYDMDPGDSDSIEVAQEWLETPAIDLEPDSVVELVEVAELESVQGAPEDTEAGFTFSSQLDLEDPEQVSCEPAEYEPVALAPEPSAWTPEHSDLVADPVVYGTGAVESDVEASAEFAWSPWAQEMGLAEPSTMFVHAAESVEPVSGTESFGLDHTDAFPVPQAPDSSAEMAVAAAADMLGINHSELPGPRLPEVAGGEDELRHEHTTSESALDPWADSATLAADEGGPQQAVPVLDEQAPGAQDPLAGGLLSHLMSSVRGM